MTKEKWVGVAVATVVVIRAIWKPVVFVLMLPIIIALGVVGVTIKQGPK